MLTHRKTQLNEARATIDALNHRIDVQEQIIMGLRGMKQPQEDP